MKEYIIKVDEYKKDIDGGMPLQDKPHELVRCKDCKYAFFKDGLVVVGHIFCTKPGTERGEAVKTDVWYCADGERKDDATD